MSALDFRALTTTPRSTGALQGRLRHGHRRAWQECAGGLRQPGDAHRSVAAKRIPVVTAKGDIMADKVIITLPTNVLAERADFFAPTLPGEDARRVAPAAGPCRQTVSVARPRRRVRARGRLFGSTREKRHRHLSHAAFRTAADRMLLCRTMRPRSGGRRRKAFFNFAVEELSAISAAISPSASSRRSSIPGARILMRRGRILTPCRVPPTSAPCWRRRSTIVYSLPAKPARRMISRPRTAPTSPVSPRRIG